MGGIFIKHKVIVATIILFALISLSCISATDNNTSDEIIAQDGINANEIVAQTNLYAEEKLTDGENEISDFSTLNGEIANSTTSTIQLTKNYTYNPEKDLNYTDGIIIDKPDFTIDGQGHTINGAGLARIFNITTNNVILKNIKFMKGNATDNGGAIYWYGNNGTINNSSFANNQADNGGAIYWYAYNGTINNSQFTNNTAKSDGGAIYWQGTDGNISNCDINSTFINNGATRGGAVFFNNETDNIIIAGYFEGNVAERTGGALCFQAKSSNNIISADFYNNSAIEASGGAIFFYSLAENNSFESIFMNNYALYGGGIFFYKKANNNRFNCDFRFNVAESCGGAIFFYNTTNNNEFTGYFINNSALGKISVEVGNGGAITFKDTSCNSIFDCDFVNNTAALCGGAVNYRQTPHNITFNGDFINNNATFGGGASFLENLEEIVFNGEFIGNSAEYGGEIAVDEGVIENVAFKNNHAKSGGAIYFNNSGAVINSNFTNNSADDADDSCGGAICFNANGTVIGSKFVNNTGGYYGGAVYLWMDGTIKDSLFNSNEAQNGGSLWVYGALEVDSCNFKDNFARIGGAIEFWKSGIVENSNFNNNTAKFNGGAISSNDNVKISNCNFTGNSAIDNSGGAVYIFGFGEFYNINFTDNYASYCGGAIYFNRNGTINQSIFTNNNAEEGGAISTKGNLIISNSGFISNSENCINVKSGSKLTLNNVSSDAKLVNDTISMDILEVKDVVYGNNINIKVQVKSSVISLLSIGKVVVEVNNVEYGADVKDGIGIIVIPGLYARSYNANVTYIDNNVSRSEIPVNFTVNKKDITINAKNAAYAINYGGTYKVSFKNVTDGTKVIFTLNGKNIGTSTIKNGAASIKLTAKILKTAKAGKKNLVIKIENSNYSPISKTVKITINKEKTKITVKAKTFKRAKKTKKYSITLKNSKNKAMKKVKVTLKVKGKTYVAKTNSKGKATFKITKLTKKGTYKAVIKYKGNKYYNKATKNVKIKIK
ncbi:hypothetical protein [Methanobrevibacter sp.]|uniref:hypothetical protein n=1 Tax=Methanobrevibacter sp. TaxID=66852 RepID=UPI00386E75B3